MAHLYARREKYWELLESYRDPVTGKPRKRLLKYLGVYSVDWRAMFASDLQGVDWNAIERQECERRDKERAAYEAKMAALNQQYGLRVGPTEPVPVEPSHAAPAPPSELEPSALPESPSEQPSEPANDSTGTAIPS